MQERITLDYSLLVSVFKNCSACAFCPHKQLPCCVYLIHWGSQTDSIKLYSDLLASGILLENIKILITLINNISSRILHYFFQFALILLSEECYYPFYFFPFFLSVCVCVCVCVCLCGWGGSTFLGRRINWGEAWQGRSQPVDVSALA